MARASSGVRGSAAELAWAGLGANPPKVNVGAITAPVSKGKKFLRVNFITGTLKN
ncbi:hypothetical protein D3C85_1799020 [compost metagenome]